MDYLFYLVVQLHFTTDQNFKMVKIKTEKI